MSGDKPGMKQALNETVASGGYEIDPAAVAAAMLTRECIRRVASGVLVAREPADLAPVGIPEDDAAALGDAA